VGFDASRPVPWKLLFRRYGLLLIGMVVVVSITNRQHAGGLLGGLLFGGVLFFGMSWLLSKFGYAPKTMAQMREEARVRAEARAASGEPVGNGRKSRGKAQPVVASPTGRPKPPPTRRTASGVGRHPKPGAKRR